MNSYYTYEQNTLPRNKKITPVLVTFVCGFHYKRLLSLSIYILQYLISQVDVKCLSQGMYSNHKSENTKLFYYIKAVDAFLLLHSVKHHKSTIFVSNQYSLQLLKHMTQNWRGKMCLHMKKPIWVSYLINDVGKSFELMVKKKIRKKVFTRELVVLWMRYFDKFYQKLHRIKFV